MAGQSNPSSFTGQLKDTIKKNEKRINHLEEEVRKLQEKLKDHEKNCQPKIKKLEEEIERLKKENKTLQEKNRKLETDIGDLKESNTFLDDEMKSIKQANGDLKKELESTSKQLKKHDEKLKTFELSEDELIIRQLCSSVQENILKFVLKGYFDEIENKNTKYIEEYMKRQIVDQQEQEKAKSRWEQLKDEIKWDDFLIKQLKSVKDSGNDTAHPFLTEEKIEEAKMNLKEKKKLSENMVEAVDQLKNMWKQTRRKLLRRNTSRSAESRDPDGRQRNPSRRQSQDNYDNYLCKPTAGGRPDIPTKA